MLEKEILWKQMKPLFLAMHIRSENFFLHAHKKFNLENPCLGLGSGSG